MFERLANGLSLMLSQVIISSSSNCKNLQWRTNRSKIVFVFAGSFILTIIVVTRDLISSELRVFSGLDRIFDIGFDRILHTGGLLGSNTN